MALNRFMVDDVEKFGRLVKDWGRGKKPIPANKEEFEAALLEAGIQARWPTGAHAIHTVIVEKVPLGTLHLLTAAPEYYAESEAYLGRPDTTYPLLDYYEMHAFHTTPNVTDKLRFNDRRIGDYTISHCT